MIMIMIIMIMIMIIMIIIIISIIIISIIMISIIITIIIMISIITDEEHQKIYLELLRDDRLSLLFLDPKGLPLFFSREFASFGV